MKTASAKAKGKKLEALVRDKLIATFDLDEDDIRIPVGSENGSDIKLSKRAQEKIPLKIECKSRKSLAVYTYMAQAEAHSGNFEPCLILKMDRKKPLAVVDLDYFLRLVCYNKWNKK